MFDNDEKLQLFLEWIFMDLAQRTPSGKHAVNSISGVLISYDDPPDPRKRGKGGTRTGPAWMRGSDAVVRRYVAIEALRRHGRSLKAACADVAVRLGKDTQGDVKSITTGYLKSKHPRRRELLPLWIELFEGWLDVEVRANLFDNGLPIRELIEVKREFVANCLCDAKKVELYMSRYEGALRRAVIWLGREQGLI